mmetsp:Transcript_6737/g.17631  ORF Transcript_6737/g.17631 Transcript_6737/m.17631 type:complete len:113 (+) Transcript_6737:985-1323(+)
MHGRQANAVHSGADQRDGRAWSRTWNQRGSLIYLIDNSACEPLTKNVGVSKPTEHFLRWQHYLRWLVYHKYAIVIWISTNDETGDMMTKTLPPEETLPEATLRHRVLFLNKN